jgi:hypothetical protein
MNLWITIDNDGACIWNKEPELVSGCYMLYGRHFSIDTDAAIEFCGNPEIPYKAQIKIEVIK